MTLFTLGAGAAAPESAPPTDEVQQALDQGDHAQALANARQAVELSAERDNKPEHLDALLDLASAYQAAGQHGNALRTLHSAMSIAETLEDPARQLLITAALGQSYAQSGQSEQAQQWLNQTIEVAARQRRPRLEATALNNLGNLMLSNGYHQEALSAYRKSITLAEQHGLLLLHAQASANAARAALALQDSELAARLLARASRKAKTLDPSHDTAYLLINIATLLQDSRNGGADSAANQLTESYELLKAAQQVARQIQDARAESYAVGYLARLYLQQGRTAEALNLTREAEFIAQQHGMPDALFRWQWQAGRILDRQGQVDDAIHAYQQAVRTLQPIRYDVASGYGQSGSAFRDVIGPLYFELADLLLRHSQQTKDISDTGRQRNLQQARDIIEQFKAAELEDFFRDDCVAQLQSRTAGLDTLDAHTAVIYPILLQDRTELLVSLPGGIRQFTVAVGAEEITNEIRNLRATLENRTNHEYPPHAKHLYDWLIKPAAESLRSADIHTLVIVPDGALRTIPWGALHTGSEFLIQRYAIAYTPGLQVTDPQPLNRAELRLLLSGLTTSVQSFPALPHVKDELDSIRKIHGGTVLLDEEYRADSMHEALSKTPYSIVHIASHGQFSNDPDQTFLLTYSDRIDMDELGQFVGIGRFRDKPVELLTLSACQTAAGDDRAALGLAGVAVKSGARSALATLWFVNDKATSLLVSDFYQNLEDPSVSKAQALQKAQIGILSDRRYRHPGYWSPYLLIGNWL